MKKNRGAENHRDWSQSIREIENSEFSIQLKESLPPQTFLGKHDMVILLFFNSMKKSLPSTHLPAIPNRPPTCSVQTYPPPPPPHPTKEKSATHFPTLTNLFGLLYFPPPNLRTRLILTPNIGEPRTSLCFCQLISSRMR